VFNTRESFMAKLGKGRETMKKLATASIVCLLALGTVVVSGAGAVKAPKQVFGTVSVTVSPNPVPAGTTSVAASGNVATNSSCRKDRTVSLAYSGSPATVIGTAETRPNGNYTATNLPLPATSGETLVATLDDVYRKVGGKKKGKKVKKGRRFHCNPVQGQSAPVVLTP
jgi:hypothetical protein